MVDYSLAISFVLSASLLSASGAGQAQSKARAPKDIAVDYCRAQSLIRLKYAKTVEWLDNGKEEKGGNLVNRGN